MPLRPAASFRAWCVAGALLLATAHAAQPPHPLIGATRDQVVAQYGDPKSQLAAGGREVLLYARERLVLRNGVVVEVERLASEPVRRPSPAPTAPAAPVAAPAAAPGAQAAPAVPGAAPELPVVGNDAAPAALPAAQSAASAAEATPPPPPEPSFEIKLVRPPSAGIPRTAPKAEPTPTPAPAPADRPAVADVPAAPAPVAAATEPARPTPASAATPPAAVAASGETAPVATATPTAAATPAIVGPESEPAESAKAADPELAKKILAAKNARRRLEQAEADSVDPTAEMFTTQTYVIALVVIAGGAGFLWWRRQQRQLELAATSVSRTPFTAPATPGVPGAKFDAATLAKLDWKHFEQLVAAYYNKTGVVAVSTKADPSAPVHVKISWKGESRPFALVQCIAQPPGLIDAKPLQDLFAVLAAEDIRRGYVVTTGKFNVPARDFAEEKHITLMPGDIFLEKLNALPDAARAELMKEIAGAEAAPAT